MRRGALARGAELVGQLGEDLLQRPDHRHVGAAELADLGGVDVEVDDGRARARKR